MSNNTDISFVSVLSNKTPAFCRIEHKVTETTATSDNGESAIPIYLITSRAVWRSGKNNEEKELRIERRVRRSSRRIKDRDLIRLEKAQNAADLTAIALTRE